jgi:Zn-dependent protease
MPLAQIAESPVFFALWVGAVIFGLTIHEFSHAFAGYLQGDNTAADHGRLTLNPLSHVDWVGFVLLVVAGFGWARPTPFNPYNLKYKKWGPALVGLAGPISNILAVVVVGIALYVISTFALLSPDNLMVVFFLYLIQVNLILAVFNLLPIPPLDGSKILYSLIADKYPQVVLTLDRYGVFLLIALVFFGGSILTPFFTFFLNIAQNLIF